MLLLPMTLGIKSRYFIARARSQAAETAMLRTYYLLPTLPIGLDGLSDEK